MPADFTTQSQVPVNKKGLLANSTCPGPEHTSPAPGFGCLCTRSRLSSNLAQTAARKSWGTGACPSFAREVLQLEPPALVLAQATLRCAWSHISLTILLAWPQLCLATAGHQASRTWGWCWWWSLCLPVRAQPLLPHSDWIWDARKRIPNCLSWTNTCGWLHWVSRGHFILTCLWWLSFKLYCESMHTLVLRWMGLPETLPLQDSCLPDPHRWTVHVWQIHTETSRNLKWKVLSAFSTCMRHHHRAMLEGCKVHRDEATTPNPLSLKQFGLTHSTVTAQRNIHTPWLLGHILTFEYWPVFTLWMVRC